MQTASVMVPRARSHAAGRRQWPVIIGALIVVGAIAFLMWSSLKETTAYFITVSELQAKGPSVIGQQVRVNGNVVPGSINRDTATGVLTFTVKDAGGQMPVVYKGIVPDIFTDDVEVVVEGRYTAGGTFEANTLLAKCPSRFEGGDKLMPPEGHPSGVPAQGHPGGTLPQGHPGG